MSLRVAVIGVGHLGRHHARILSSLPGVQLVAVVDTNRARAEEIARTVGAKALFDAGALIDAASGFERTDVASGFERTDVASGFERTDVASGFGQTDVPSGFGQTDVPSGFGQTDVASGFSRTIGTIDAVTIAVPTELHRDIAMPFLKAGISVLVEKPMAKSLAEADELIAAATESSVALAVGHTERFNPAVESARALLVDPRFIEVHRLGTFPDRSLDIDVVFDLMIHDLDVVLSLVKADVESIEAVGVPVLTGRVDIANVRLRFANGCIANLTASRISRDRVRKIRFFQPAAYLSVDYAAQKIELWRLVKGAGPMPSIEGGEVPVANEEPLKRELADFVDAVVSKRTPLVDGHQGRRALELASRITSRMASS